MSMYRSILGQTDDTVPPDQEVLEIDVFGENVVLQISDCSEDTHETRYKSKASVTVNRELLLHALQCDRVIGFATHAPYLGRGNPNGDG